MATCLCWGGRFEESGIMLSVKEGFLYMEVVHLVGVLWIVTSRKFIWILDSSSDVDVTFGWSVLKFSFMFLVAVWGET